MSKTEQVRVPTDLTRDARIIAQELYGEPLTEFIARLLRAAIEKELPKAAQKISERAKQLPAAQDADKGKPAGGKKPPKPAE